MAASVRPWCACGRVRLADSRETRTVETAKRLHIHSEAKCTVYAVKGVKS